MTIEKTITRAKTLNKEAGLHWFDKDTMKFFNTRIVTGILKEKYFISSEFYRDWQTGDREPTKYTIREVNWKTGDVSTVGEFQAYDSLKAAKEAVKDLPRL